MKILQLCHRVPFPANDGGNIAMLSIADSLISQGVEYKMLALNTRKHHVKFSSLSDYLHSKYKLQAIDVDTAVKPLVALQNLFSQRSYNVERFNISEFHHLLMDHLKESIYD